MNLALRIVVADDHEMVRDGFAALLDTQPDFTIVGTAADGAQVVRVYRDQRPDVVLMDVRMPVVDGITATRTLTAEAVDDRPRVIILTTFDLDEYVFDALAAGASGFLLKDGPAQRLFEAIRVVAAGESLLAPSVTRRLISEFVRIRGRTALRPSLPNAHSSRDRRPATVRRRTVQSGDSRAPCSQRGDRQVAREPSAEQARPPGPHSGGDSRL
jgi:DNA-binding NarL/FixJ family response regulator